MLKAEITVVTGLELCSQVKAFERAGRRLLSISVGRTNAEWILESSHKRELQEEFPFALPLTGRPFLNAGRLLPAKVGC